jgi:hypothetical protein
MLCAGSCDTDNIDFLKSIVSDQRGRDLTGENNEGDGVHKGSGNPGHRIRRPRAGSDYGHPYLSCGPGIPVRRMDSRLFMSNQKLVKWSILKFIKEGEYDSTGIIKKSIHSLLFQTFNNDLRTVLFHGKSLMSNAKAQIKSKAKMTKQIAQKKA